MVRTLPNERSATCRCQHVSRGVSLKISNLSIQTWIISKLLRISWQSVFRQFSDFLKSQSCVRQIARLERAYVVLRAKKSDAARRHVPPLSYSSYFHHLLVAHQIHSSFTGAFIYLKLLYRYFIVCIYTPLFHGHHACPFIPTACRPL
jgi:hypothetical protein